MFQFNLYSAPLLIGFLQGVIYAVMLFRRNVMKSGQAARKKSLFARVTGK